MSHRFFIFTIALAVLLPVPGVAQGEGEIQTFPEDQGYGEHELAPQAHFPKLSEMRGPVDRRNELNPLANRAITWSSGHLPKKGTIQFQNTLLVGQRIAYSPTDSVQISTQAYLPLIPQSYLAIGGQGYIASGDAWNFTLGGTLRHRRTNLFPGTNDTGLTLDAIFDVIGTNNLSWNAGISLHVPLRHALDIVDSSKCANRRELAEGECIQAEPQARLMPSSGYWVAAYAGMNYFVTDWLLFNFEFFTGASQSNFWAFDSVWESTWYGRELSYEAEQELVESTQWSSGLGPFGPVNLGMGTTWIYKRIAINGSFLVMSIQGEARLMPFITVGLNLGG